MVDKVKANEYSKVCVQWNSSNMNWERKQSKQQDKDKVRCGDGSYESLMHNNINHTCRRWKFIYCVSCILAHECLPQANESDKKKRQQQNERVMKMAMSKCSKTKWAKDKATATKEPKIKWKREKKNSATQKQSNHYYESNCRLFAVIIYQKSVVFGCLNSQRQYFSRSPNHSIVRAHTHTHTSKQRTREENVKFLHAIIWFWFLNNCSEQRMMNQKWNAKNVRERKISKKIIRIEEAPFRLPQSA